MSKILMIGENEELRQRLESGWSGQSSRLTLSRRDWRDIKRHPPTRSEADVLIVDLTASDACKTRGLNELQIHHPRLLFVLSADASSYAGSLSRLLQQPNVDFVRPFADTNEIWQRIYRLLRRRQTKPKTAIRTVPGPTGRNLVPELHHAESGRLDARRIAEFYGIPLADVARALQVSLSRLHKTPAAASAQTSLFLFERIAYALLLLVGTQENARIWLNLPEAQLSNQTPMALLREGRGHIVAQMLDDMLNGQPS